MRFSFEGKSYQVKTATFPLCHITAGSVPVYQCDYVLAFIRLRWLVAFQRSLSSHHCTKAIRIHYTIDAPFYQQNHIAVISWFRGARQVSTTHIHTIPIK